jgi:hypothetical protein
MDRNRQTKQKGKNRILQRKMEMEIETEKMMHGRNEKKITNATNESCFAEEMKMRQYQQMKYIGE